MGLRFSKRIPLVPGLRLNFSKSGPSLSVGHVGGWITVGSRSARATVGIPGTGLSWTETAPTLHMGHQAAFLLVAIVVVALLIAAAL